LVRRNWHNFVSTSKDLGKHLASGVQRHQLLNRAGDYSINKFGFIPMVKIERHAATVVDCNALSRVTQNQGHSQIDVFRPFVELLRDHPASRQQ
jgi:hypothetical protein